MNKFSNEPNLYSVTKSSLLRHFTFYTFFFFFWLQFSNFCFGFSVLMFEWDRIKGYFYILSGLDAKVILASQNKQEYILVIV